MSTNPNDRTDQPVPRAEALDPVLRRMMRAEALRIDEVCRPLVEHGLDIIPSDEVVRPDHDPADYAPPAFLSLTAPELVPAWRVLLNEVREVNEEWVGVSVLGYQSYCACTADHLELERRIADWLGDYVRIRSDARHLCPRFPTPLHLFEKVTGEVAQLLRPHALRRGTLNAMFFNTGFAYARWLAYDLLLAPLARRGEEDGLRDAVFLRRDEVILRDAIEIGDAHGWRDDPLGDLARVVARTDPGLAERYAGVTDGEIRVRLADIAADIGLIRPYLVRNFNPAKAVIAAAGVHAAWGFMCGRGIGRLILDADRGRLLRGAYGRTCHGLFAVTYDGLLAVPVRPWHTAADHPGADGIRPLAVNLALMERVHDRLLSFYDRIDQTRMHPRPVEAVPGDIEEDFALAAACRALAAGAAPAEPARGRRLPALRLRQFAGVLEEKFGCEVRGGKGSEVVVTRPGGGRTVLGRHKADPEYHPYAVRRVLGRLGIDPRAFIAAVE